MFEVLGHTLREKRTGILVFTAFIFLFGLTMVAAYDSIGSELDLDELLESYPDVILEFFGGSIESFGEFGGFFSLEYLTWVWFLIVPAYLAMMCSGLIAGEIENKTADLLLSYPVSRRGVLLEKFGAVGFVVLLVNVFGFLSAYIGVAAYGIDFSIKWMGYAMIQATPFLLAWGAVFTLLSVLISDSKKVSMYSIAIVFFAYFVDVLSRIWTEISFLGNFSPMHYFDPSLVMSKNVVEWGDAAILAVVACAVVALSLYLFDKRDIL